MDKIIGVRVDKTIYRDGMKVIKCFDKNYTKAQVLNEALNQARVEETNLLVPKLISTSTNHEGKWLIEYEYIEGNTLESLMSKNNDSFLEYLDKFITLQMKVHNTEVLMLNKLKDKLNFKIEQTDLLATVRYELRQKLESMPKHNKLCHGDFNPSNIIVNDLGEFYIIDWAHAATGNASADVAFTYLEFMINYGEDKAKIYLQKFCEKSETNEDYIKSWLPIVAAARLNKAKKNEVEFLMSIINARNTFKKRM